MPSAEIDTLAETRELRAAGIEAAHAEAIVNTVRRTTDGLLTESRFEAAMAEQLTYLDQRLGEQRTYLDQRLNEQRAYLEKCLAEQRTYLDQRLNEQHIHLDQRLGEQRVYLEKRLGEHTVAIAELKSEIYRYLWLHGSMIVLVLTSLYAMVESWSRGQL